MYNHTYPTGYIVPRHNVLLITCMDLRLLDDIVRFMDRENLTNRYDQYIMAGASLGVLVGNEYVEAFTEEANQYKHWRQGLKDHLRLSIDLHHIEDIYLIEHRNCGAYKHFLRDGGGDFDKAYEKGGSQSFDEEKRVHHDVAGFTVTFLKEELSRISEEKGKEIKVQIHAFLMDLRGNIELLHTTAPREGEFAV